MTQFRKKPVVIDAIQFTKEDKNRAFNFITCNHYADWDSADNPTIRIETTEGEMTASLGDWIIKGVKGEFYPCKPDIFALTYEPAALSALAQEQGGMCKHGADICEFCPPPGAQVAALPDLEANAKLHADALKSNLVMLVKRMSRRLRKHKGHTDDDALANQADQFLQANGLISVKRESCPLCGGSEDEGHTLCFHCSHCHYIQCMDYDGHYPNRLPGAPPEEQRE